MVDFWLSKALNLCLSFMFLGAAWGAMRIIGVWLNPASIFLLFWFLYTFLPLLVAFEAPVSPWAMIYLLSFGLAFAIPFSLFRWPVAFAHNSNKREASYYFQRPVVIKAFYACSSISLILILLSILQQGSSLEQILFNSISTAGEFAHKRYNDQLESSIYGQLGLQFSYYTVVLGGLVYGSSKFMKRKTKIGVLLLSFAPSIEILLLQSAKGLIVFSIFLFFAAILVDRIYNKNYILFSSRAIRSLAIYACIFFLLISLSFVSRGVSNESDSTIVLTHLVKMFVSYSSGHLPAFSDWFSNRYLGESLFRYDQREVELGFNTFTWFFKLMGSKQFVPMGYYDEFYTFGDLVQSNIYTVFRGLIFDFTLLGSLVFACFAGFICALIFWKLLCERFSASAIVLFIFSVGISYQTYLISTLVWRSIPIVVLALSLMLTFLIKVRLFHAIK
jgi:oligosaccharide repeat unit polymerase